MDRYSTIDNKIQREIVLLKGYPCVWGKCSFCDYIDDNSKNEKVINEINMEVLSKVTGKYGVLEVINSGSCFELPLSTLEEIKRIIKDKNIKRLFLESHWCYKNKIKDMREYFGIPITFKIGVETFDYDFRNGVLNKNVKFKTLEELKENFDSPCIMVGIKGQSKEQIDNDMDILLNNFKHGTVNVFVDNSTNVKRDEALVQWFMAKYKSVLDKHSTIDVLYNNTDFGVGE